MTGLKEINLSIIIPAGAGILIGLVGGARLVLFLLKKSKLMVYSAIIGMVIGSVVPVFPPGVGINADSAAGAACLLCGIAAAYLLGRKTKIT